MGWERQRSISRTRYSTLFLALPNKAARKTELTESQMPFEELLLILAKPFEETRFRAYMDAPQAPERVCQSFLRHLMSVWA
jgi:hypothetical protein